MEQAKLILMRVVTKVRQLATYMTLQVAATIAFHPSLAEQSCRALAHQDDLFYFIQVAAGAGGRNARPRWAPVTSGLRAS